MAYIGFKLSEPYSDYIDSLNSTGNIQMTLMIYAGIQAIIGFIAFGTLNLCVVVLVHIKLNFSFHSHFSSR
jgi:hypothetical protein